MEEMIELARAKDTKERMAGVERLYQHLETSRRSLTSSETTSLVDCCLDLLKDNNNFRISEGALQALTSGVVLSADNFKLHFNALVPAVVDRLGDAKQPVRDAARRLLLTLMEVSSPTIIVERAGSYAWTHKSWRIREEFARTVVSAIGLFASTELTLQRAILPPILQMLNDPNSSVRDAAMLCIEEMYAQAGSQFRDELYRHHLPISMLKDLNARLEKIEPQVKPSDGFTGKFVPAEAKLRSINPKKSSQKAKSSTRDVSLFGAENDVTEKPIDPIKVYSEKELIREIDKIASTLVPEKDWSIRIVAMQRVEGLVLGGAADYPCFGGLLRQLVSPLSKQLSDRRSSIVKQACRLLCFLSKELLGDFEMCAEMFIPVLFKLVVITVLVIAESADNCIKTMLHNCKVSRVLPRIADCAMNDRNAILRARCCEYALLIFEHWPDAPEIQRSADLFEDLIRSCVADANSEVRSTARMCYRMFAKTWPARSRQLFSSFDPVIQRLINEEDGGLHRQHASPSLPNRTQVQFIPQATEPSFPGYGTSVIVAMDRTLSLSSGASLSSGPLLPQASSLSEGTECGLESVLRASKQKVSAIESMLKGLEISDKQDHSIMHSSSLDPGVDPPSSCDPSFPAVFPVSNQPSNSVVKKTASDVSKCGNHNGSMGISDIITPRHASKDSPKLSHRSSVLDQAVPSIPSYSDKRASEKLQERGSLEETKDSRNARRFANSSIERHYMDTSSRNVQLKDAQNSHIPNFQRPLLRKQVTGWMSTGSRRSVDDSQVSLRDAQNYVEGPGSLLVALSEGLNPSSDWSAKVAAFNYVQSLLQQGTKGIQEVIQNFEKVMKLFFKHLDDPHYKVAQAALSTLADVIRSCRKPFESYMERILPHVFSRLIDPKELVRQPCSTTLEIVSRIYSIDTLLPSLLRSFDEQRSPMAKLAVIEFATTSFYKHAANSEGSGNINILTIWLAKLMPLAYDKNSKLKEAAIACILSVYSHFDSIAVLNYILSLPVEGQNSFRRVLKQHTPRIEVDLMNFLQNKKEHRSKTSYDRSDAFGTSSEEGYVTASKNSYLLGRYSSGSADSDGGRKWSYPQDSTCRTGSYGHLASDETKENLYQNLEIGSSIDLPRNRDSTSTLNSLGHRVGSPSGPVEKVDGSFRMDGLSISHHDIGGLMYSEPSVITETIGHDDVPPKLYPNHYKPTASMFNSLSESGPSIPQILYMMCTGNEESPGVNKCWALQQLVEASNANDYSVWSNYFNQILTAALEVLHDSDPSIRELALSLITEMLKNQKNSMEDCIEIVIEMLLHVTKDTTAPKVFNEAECCLTVVMSQYDPFRCLSVVAPLLVTEDEKTLIICINCLTKLVGRLSQEELTAYLPSFLPALFQAFSNQSADVRKTVVFCLVDIYIILGNAFLPHLQELNSTQLRLVTIYANRILQARSDNLVDASGHD